MSEWTTIMLTRETVEKLKDLGKKGQRYNEIIIRLIEQNRAREAQEQ